MLRAFISFIILWWLNDKSKHFVITNLKWSNFIKGTISSWSEQTSVRAWNPLLCSHWLMNYASATVLMILSHPFYLGQRALVGCYFQSLISSKSRTSIPCSVENLLWLWRYCFFKWKYDRDYKFTSVYCSLNVKRGSKVKFSFVQHLFSNRYSPYESG